MSDKSENITTKAVLEAVEKLLYPILSPRQPLSKVETSLLKLKSQKDLKFVLHWVEVIVVSNVELAYIFCSEVGKASKLLDSRGLYQWLNNSLTIYDREGLYPAVNVLLDIKSFNREYLLEKYACNLEEVKPRLDLFIRGLVGRALLIKAGSEVYTDTKYLYLPKTIFRYRDKNKNKALYKSMACFLWAQTWYGTFLRKNYKQAGTQTRLNSYKDKVLAKNIFLFLENIRLMASIKRELPGLYREMSSLSSLKIPNDKTWKLLSDRLSHRDANVEDSFSVLDILIKTKLIIPKTVYQGVINAAQADSTIDLRKEEIVSNINSLCASEDIDTKQVSQAIEGLKGNSLDEEDISSIAHGIDSHEKTQLGNSELLALLKSLLQDVESLEIEDILGNGLDCLTGNQKEIEPNLKAVKADYYLDEWDYLRQSYRKDWCHLKIKVVEAPDSNFKQETNLKYPFIVSKIRKTFEAMRDQPRMVNRQTDGEEIDLEAVVDMVTARSSGEEYSERMYIRRQRTERSVAVTILVDMSGSTKGWINLAMRESIILFSEALSTLGDQYAIYGFSGLTRQRCEFYTIKTFNDSYSHIISNRIANIKARDYTRMGFAIRSASQTLLKINRKHKILLLISDGKPDDYDGYQGEYGIQDTRKAIQEAQGHGISPFCITIDKQAQIYLPRLFGLGNYIILSDVSALPLKLSEIYRKLSA